jgi:hypothetical protein
MKRLSGIIRPGKQSIVETTETEDKGWATRHSSYRRAARTLNMSFKPKLVIAMFAVSVGPAMRTVEAQMSAMIVVERLKEQYTLTRTGVDSSGAPLIEAGTVLVIQESGILGVPPGITTARPATYKEGKLHAPVGGGIGGRSRLLQVGEKVYVTKIDANLTTDTVAFTILECDSCNGANAGSAYKAVIVFQFPKGYVATSDTGQIEDVIDRVLAPGNASSKPDVVNPDQESTEAGGSFTNADVIKLVQAKLPDSIILAKIKSSACNFDLSTEELIKLKRAGTSEAVLLAMTDAMTAIIDQPGPNSDTASAPDCNDYGSCFKSGSDAFQAAQWDQALAYFQKASSLEPSKLDAWARMGSIYLASGQYERAQAMWDKTLSLGGPLTFVVCLPRSGTCQSDRSDRGPEGI